MCCLSGTVLFVAALAVGCAPQADAPDERDDLSRARDLASRTTESSVPRYEGDGATASSTAFLNDDLASFSRQVRALVEEAAAAYERARSRATTAAERNRARREAASLWIWFVTSVLEAGESAIPAAMRSDQEQVATFMESIKEVVHHDLHEGARLLQECADEPDGERIAEACRALTDCTVVLYERGPAEGRACQKAVGSGVVR